MATTKMTTNGAARPRIRPLLPLRYPLVERELRKAGRQHLREAVIHEAPKIGSQLSEMGKLRWQEAAATNGKARRMSLSGARIMLPTCSLPQLLGQGASINPCNDTKIF